MTSGPIEHAGAAFTAFHTSIGLTAEQREVADAAMKAIWDRHLQHRADDGKTHLVADWRDIDDGSSTLYFERLASGKLRLAIDQFNN